MNQNALDKAIAMVIKNHITHIPAPAGEHGSSAALTPPQDLARLAVETYEAHLPRATKVITDLQELKELPPGTVLWVDAAKPELGANSWELFDDVHSLLDDDGQLAKVAWVCGAYRGEYSSERLWDLAGSIRILNLPGQTSLDRDESEVRPWKPLLDSFAAHHVRRKHEKHVPVFDAYDSPWQTEWVCVLCGHTAHAENVSCPSVELLHRELEAFIATQPSRTPEDHERNSDAVLNARVKGSDASDDAAPTAELIIYGASDDLLEIEGAYTDELDCINPTEFLVASPDGQQLVLTAGYGPKEWELGVLAVSGTDIPSWPVTFARRQQTNDPQLHIIAPVGTTITPKGE